MPLTLDLVSNDARVLPPDQRVELAYRLLVSIESDLDADAAWESEIVNRIARFEAGAVSAVPASEVFANLRKLAPSR